MSRWFERVRLRSHRGQGGFTLIEIMVAITLVSIAAGGAIPLLIVGMKAANNSKFQTQAKNLAQERLESMRDLPFHVDRQNGPYVDLLDIYYTQVSATAGATITNTRAGETETGSWVSGGASSPAPSGAFYKVTVDPLPGFSSFSQTIYTQFLKVTGSALSVPSTTTYDNETAGKDQPLSSLVGVTVVTTWNDHGTTHNYTSYTRIADSRGLTDVLTTQASANFLQVTSGGSSGNTLTAQLASADATGSLSTGSIAAGEVHPVQAQDSSGTTYDVNHQAVTSSGDAPINTGAASPAWQAGTNECGWVGSGQADWAGVTATTGNGLPQVPSNVDTNSPPSNQVVAKLTASPNNNDCGTFGFANQSVAYDPALQLRDNVPLVSINRVNGASTITVVKGSAWVNASAATATPHTASSGANTSSTETVRLFPGTDFTGDKGVVKVTLSQASISCLSSVSGGVATQSASGSWTVNMSYWSASRPNGAGPGYIDLPQYTWNSSTGSATDPLASLDPSTIVVYQDSTTTLHLSDYIGSWSTTRKITENANSGVHQLDGIVSITSAPTRAGDLLSAIGLQIGNLSCVADDNR